MPQLDFLSRQIEQMGKVLAKILADFLHLPDTVEPEEGIVQSTQQLKELLDLDLNELNALNSSELTKFLKQRNFNPELMENLAHYLHVIGSKQVTYDKPSAFSSYRTALQILEAADAISETYSFKREEMKREIHASLA